MPAKKSTKKAAPIPAPSPDPKPETRFRPVVREDGKYFSRADMLELQLAEARLEAAKHGASVKLAEAQEFKRAAEKRLEDLGREVDDARKLAMRRAEELSALQTEIGAAYEVDLRRVAFDDITGRITML